MHTTVPSSPSSVISKPSLFFRLFSYMNENGVFSSPTYSTFAAIFNNYIAQTGNTEHVSSAESAENEAFLSEIMKTQVMAKLHDFLRWKGELVLQLSDAKD